MPITLAMTFGMANMVHIDLQQVSIATLIIALGLLVDDPVVANDAIKRELAAGIPRHSRGMARPHEARSRDPLCDGDEYHRLPAVPDVTGSTGDFLHSLPIVMTAALISSRLASMTFIPLLAYYLLRAPERPEPTIEEKRRHKASTALLPAGRRRDPLALGRAGPFAAVSAGGGLHRDEAEESILSR